MTWNPSQILGPIAVPITEPVTIEGETFEQVTGYRDGYHLNIDPALLTEAMAPHVVTPEQPYVVFSGQETVFLRFEDEAEARSVMDEHWTDAA